MVIPPERLFVPRPAGDTLLFMDDRLVTPWVQCWECQHCHSINEWAAPRCCQCDRPKPVGVAALEASKPFDEEDFRKVEEANDFMTGSGYVTERSFSAQPERIKAAAEEWACYSSWYPVSTEGDAAVYRAGRFAWLSGDMRIKVIPQLLGGKTDARFEIGLRRRATNGRTVPIRGDFAGAAEHFADGLSDELTFQMMTMSGEAHEQLRRRRERLRKVNRAYTTAYWLVPAALAPVTAIVWLVTRSGLGTLAAFFWMMTLYSLNALLQARHIGMRAIAAIFLVVIVCVVGIGATLAATLGGH